MARTLLFLPLAPLATACDDRDDTETVPGGATARPRAKAVGEGSVDVRVQGQGAAEPLDLGDGSAAEVHTGRSSVTRRGGALVRRYPGRVVVAL